MNSKFNITTRPFLFPASRGGGGGGVTDNIYTIDDALTGNRTLTGAGFFLDFTGVSTFSVDATSLVELVSAVGFTIQGGGGANMTLTQAGTGNIVVNANDGEILLQQNTKLIGIGGAGMAGVKMDIEVEAGTDPIAFYENRGGGALIGDNQTINFAYNDSLGARVDGTGNIISRVVVVGAGTVESSLTFGDVFQVRSDGKVLLSSNATTDSALAAFEIDNDLGINNNLWVTSNASTASDILAIFRNRAGNTLFNLNGQGKLLLNSSNIVTGDLQHEGFTDTNLFYSDAGVDKVGVGVKPGVTSSKFTVNGDMETLTNTKGYIVLDRTDGNRYRIYTDGGVVFTELA